ncbi:SH3 domain-containing protein [uncultured Marinobacter sp.]|uniref:SH3 domain-containing protein n=1 Tax=Marinobacter salarius TaxID=1420917 RepID=UPI002611602F|nr:SH3 domain-containing protein [uncultured Marinobacter sp.]
MAQALQDLPGLQLAKEFQHSTAMQAVRDLCDSSTMRRARELADSQMMQGIRELQYSSSVQAALDLHDSTMMRSIRELQSSTAMQLYKDIHDPQMMRVMQGLEDFPALAMMEELRDSPIANALRGLDTSSLMPALSRLTRTPFDPELIHRAVAIAQRAGYEYQTADEVLHAEFATVEAELNSFGNESLDFTSLSERARTALLWLFYWLVLPYLMSIAAGITLDRFDEKSAVTENVRTSREAKKLARCDNGLERQIFAGCRVVIGSGLRLRAGPGMRAEIITTLPLGKLVTVLDSSERAWLHVEVDLEGDVIEGWVARRYTTPFR